MDYEFITFEIYEPPLIDTPVAGKCEYLVGCTSGVVGDTYGFEKTDTITVECDMGNTLDVQLAKIQTECQNFVAATYPNT